MDPESAAVGAPGFTFTLTGTGFVSGSLVYWDSAALATTFVSSSHLAASVPSTALLAAGTVSVTVVNPAPGGGSSAPLPFEIVAAPGDFYAYLPLLVRRLVVAPTVGAITVRPAYSTLGAGDTVTVDVWLEDVEDYYGLEFKLTFDPEVIVVPAGGVTSVWEVFDEAHHFVAQSEIDNVAGLVWYAVTNAHPAGEFTGTGRVCSITFVGAGPGTAVLGFSDASPPTAGTLDGELMYPLPVGGQQIVVAE
jgi:hypothetical protein